MTTLFVSDLHLDLEREPLIDLFEAFVARRAVAADALYILGDLFEAWIGDDADDPVGTRFIQALKPLREARRPCYFIHGNRDFLLGEGFARAAGLTLLADASVIDLYGRPTLLMHGDVLCSDDHAYQAFRRQSHAPAWQRAFLARSVEERRAFAAQARGESRRHTGDMANAAIMDVNTETVAIAMRNAGVQRLIHGHTHRPAIHHFELDGTQAERIVLTDWYNTGGALEVDPGGYRAIDLAA